jgi:CHAT domain-containing protein/Tfp pilus assembly protein PilF
MKERLLLICTLFLLSGYAIAQNETFNKDSVFTWGINAYANGDFESALQHFETYFENTSDTTSAQYATALHKTGNIALLYGDTQTALKYYQTSLAIREKLFGKSHPDCGASLANIGNAFQNMGKYADAIDYLLRGAEIDKKFFGEKSQFYGEDMHNIGNSYYGLRDYDNAEKYYCEAAKIKAITVGNDSYDYATTIVMLANLYGDLGQNETAMKYYESAAEIIGATQDRQDTYANVLSNMGTLYSALGNYSKALEKYNEAKSILEKLGMKKTITYINILTNVASAYFFMTDYDKSLEIDKQVAEITKAEMGESTIEYATAANNIGTIYMKTAEYAKALDYLRKAAKIRKDILGENNIEYAKSLNNIGNTLLLKGDTKASADTLVKAYKIAEAVYGKDHNGTTDYLLNIANCYMKSGDYKLAHTYLQKSLNIGSKSLRENFSFLSSRERELYWQNNVEMYRAIIENSSHITTDTSAARCSYNAELVTKGLLLTSEMEFNKLIAESKDTKLIAEFEKMRQLGLILNGELEKQIDERTYNCDSLENEIQKIERHLVENCRQYGDFTRSIAINWKDVQKSLKPNDAAIEFANYTENDTTKYAAIVLTKSMESPIFVPLFNENDIARLLRGITPAKPDAPKDDDNRGASTFTAKRQGIYESTGLYNLMWKPLEKYFPENPRIYFAPSGMLHQIAVEYAPISHEQTISDKYEIYRVSSTRFLAMDYMPKPMKNSVLYGGIFYDSDTTTMKRESDRYSTRGGNTIRSFSTLNRDEDRGSLNYLPGTKTEVENIVGNLKKNRVKTKLYEGIQANEESFKALSGKEISTMHIATHGFFLPTDEKLSGDQSLVQSGLLLSGANYAWQNQPLPEGIEDGILTAKEISFMDLRKTDLVVLSACQTALGEITGEGVFGLQRGFKKAGVRTIIMSLWPVDDNATLLMMTEFYTNLTKGMTKREAFLTAQNKVKTTEGFENPRYWAAFIMLDGNEK